MAFTELRPHKSQVRWSGSVLCPFISVDVWHSGETRSYMYEPQQSALWLQMIPSETPAQLIQNHAVACPQML